MRAAVIDCGTNTFNLLIAEIQQEGWKELFRTKIAVKLGRGGIGKGTIQSDRLARGLDALRVFHDAGLNYAVDHFYVTGTSALREADNAIDFVRRAKELFDIDVRIIDGEREASLIFSGVKQTLDIGDQNFTVMDIGGGSTEFIIANKDGVQWKTSTDLGVSRLFDFLSPTDPLSKENRKDLSQVVDEHLAPLKEALSTYPSTTLLGSSGSFDTLVAMAAGLKDDTSKLPLSNEISLIDFATLHSWMLSKDRGERLRIRGMLPLRVDYMPISTSLIDHMIQKMGYDRILQSKFALKEGVLQEIIEKKIHLE